MTDNVTPLFGGTLHPPAGPDVNIVELLEDLLKQAKAGEIGGIAVATVTGNLNYGSAYCSTVPFGLALVGAVEILRSNVTPAVRAALDDW